MIEKDRDTCLELLLGDLMYSQPLAPKGHKSTRPFLPGDHQTQVNQMTCMKPDGAIVSYEPIESIHITTMINLRLFCVIYIMQSHHSHGHISIKSISCSIDYTVMSLSNSHIAIIQSHFIVMSGGD